MSCISGDTFLLPLFSHGFYHLPPPPSTLHRASLRSFPGFACTRGQINVDGAPRAPFCSLSLSLFLSLSLVSLSICPYLSVRPRDFFSDSQLSWSITRYDADLYSRAFYAGGTARVCTDVATWRSNRPASVPPSNRFFTHRSLYATSTSSVQLYTRDVKRKNNEKIEFIGISFNFVTK